MSKPRTPRAAAGKTAIGTSTTPALVNRATPPAETAEGGVVADGTPTTPAVASTEPLPSDQATAAPRPIGGQAVVTEAEIDLAQGDRPSIVPETATRAELVAASDEAVTGGVRMERVPSTVPLPADQISPVAATPVPALAATLAMMSAEDRAAMRAWLGIETEGAAPLSGLAVDADDVVADLDDAFEGERRFPVAYDVDLDGVSYPVGDSIVLTFAQWKAFFRATAVTAEWLHGEVVEA